MLLAIVFSGTLSAYCIAYDIISRNKQKLVLLNAAKSRMEEIYSYMSAPGRTVANLDPAHHNAGDFSQVQLADPTGFLQPLGFNYLVKNAFPKPLQQAAQNTFTNTFMPTVAAANLYRLTVSGVATTYARVQVTASDGTQSVKLVAFFFR
jgi:hypothetical protein